MFAGEASAAELPAYYDAADVFAMPCRSRWFGLDVEGLGVVYLEAAASALPVVVGNSGGAADAVISGETGLVVPSGGAGILGDQVTTLLSDPTAAREMGARGRAWMERDWSWEKVGRQFGELLGG